MAEVTPQALAAHAQSALVAAIIFALLAGNAYFGLSILSGEPKNRKRRNYRGDVTAGC
ncbi:MAG: hypothetical protein WBD71_21200 [Xanthobacteraceae bacterium]